jgi:hypothetical protein
LSRDHAPQPALLPALVAERHRMYAARLHELDSKPIRTSTRTLEAAYTTPELTEPAVRLGADDHMGLPSRRGDRLVYRDGREVQLVWLDAGGVAA